MKVEKINIGDRTLSLELDQVGDDWMVDLWDDQAGLKDCHCYGADFLNEDEALAEFLRVLEDPIRFL